MAEALVANVLRFAELLRLGGLDVHTGRIADVVTALERVGVRRRQDVQAALRALLVHRREDLAFFNEMFDWFWRAWTRGGGDGLPLVSLGERPRVAAAPAPGTRVELEAEGGPGESAAARLAAGAWSDAESLRTRDFADLTPGELRQAEARLAELPRRLAMHRTRRWARAASGAVDLRPILRANMKHGGELLQLPRRERREKPRPIVVLADVSGSMERYARVLLQFVCGMTAGADAESFVFATRLTRVTRLVARGASRRVAAVAREAQDWGGGTRIGEALRAFNVHWARRVMRHGPVVLIVSDGWDRGEPALLARELARVRRSCHRLIWLNPLLGSASYEPLTRGMRAALPLVDDFLPAHNLASLEALAAHLETLPRQRHAH